MTIDELGRMLDQLTVNACLGIEDETERAGYLNALLDVAQRVGLVALSPP